MLDGPGERKDGETDVFREKQGCCLSICEHNTLPNLYNAHLLPRTSSIFDFVLLLLGYLQSDAIFRRGGVTEVVVVVVGDLPPFFEVATVSSIELGHGTKCSKQKMKRRLREHFRSRSLPYT